MEFFKPQITLTKITNIDAPDQYELTATTLCDKSNYQARGFEVAKKLNEAGNLEVVLLIGTDNTIDETNDPSTVEHSVVIDRLPAGYENIDIEAIVATSGQASAMKGKTVVKSADSDADDRDVTKFV